MTFNHMFPPPHPPSDDRPTQTHVGRRALLWGIVLIVGIAIIASASGAPVEAAATSIPPTLNVSPTQIHANTDCPFPTGVWFCQVTLSEAAGSHGKLHWSSSESGGINFFAIVKPSSGTLSPDQKVKVAIHYFWDGCPSSAAHTNGTVTFSGSVNSVKVHLSCAVDPSLTVSPLSFQANKNCSFTTGKGWTCVATLSGSNQKQLSWFTGSDTSGVTFQPASGTLSMGQTTRVSIFVPTRTCPATVMLNFFFQINSISIPWSC